jgi:hypothetical protein
MLPTCAFYQDSVERKKVGEELVWRCELRNMLQVERLGFINLML